MSWRCQPPVYSPVSTRALAAGVAGCVGLSRPDTESIRAGLAERFGPRDVVLVDSGTSALVLAIRAVAPLGATVAFPGYGCIDLTAAALRAGVRVRLYDVDPNTLSPDLDSVRAVLSRGVAAIVVAHLYGYPADVVGVQEIAAAHGVPVIEDAAQGGGGALAGIRLGGIADVALVSFGRGKGIAAGAGGALLQRAGRRTEEGSAIPASLGAPRRGAREVAALSAQWLLARPSIYRIPLSVPSLKLGETVFHPAGEPCAMTSASISMLPSALRLEQAETRTRIANAHALLERSGHWRAFDPVQPIAGGRPGYLRLAVLARTPGIGGRVELGAVRGYPLTLDEHVQLRPILAPGERAAAGARRLRDTLFTLPTHSRVNSRDLARLSAFIRSAGVR